MIQVNLVSSRRSWKQDRPVTARLSAVEDWLESVDRRLADADLNFARRALELLRLPNLIRQAGTQGDRLVGAGRIADNAAVLFVEGSADWLTGRDNHLVGIEISEDAVRVCRTHRQAGKSRLVQAAEIELPMEVIVDGAIMNKQPVIEALEKIRAQFEANGLPKRVRAVFGQVGHHIVIKRIELPLMTETELAGSLSWEAEQHIPYDINDVNIDSQIVNRHPDREMMDIILVAAKKDMVNDYESVIAEAGFVPAIADINCFALQNALEATRSLPKGETIAFVDVGASITTVYIIADGVMEFARDTSTGVGCFIEELRKQLGVGYDEAARLLWTHCGDPAEGAQRNEDVERIIRSTSETVAGEIQRSLDFYSAITVDSQVSRIYFSGIATSIGALGKALNSGSGLTVEVASFPPDIAAVLPTDPRGQARWAVPIGLALRDARPTASRISGTSSFKRSPCISRPRGFERRPGEKVAGKQYKPSRRELVRFCEAFGFMLSVGVPILDALEVVASDPGVGGKQFRQAIAAIRERISEGKNLSDGFRAVLASSPIIEYAIMAGEASGALVEVLEACGRYLRTGSALPWKRARS